MWSNDVGCCEFHFYGFFIMNISVCFLEKVKIICFIHCYIFINVKHSFLKSTQFLYGIVLSWHGRTEILVPMLTFVHDGRGTSTNILIFATHAHLASLLLNTICCTSLATWRVSGPLHDRFRPLLHTCSHSPRDYAQVPNS
jgi:hypothetical protein